MPIKIRRAAVLGSGVMGAQIAAHLAAAGVRVHLLDLASDEPPKDKKLAKVVGNNVRSSRAILAVENLKKMKPSPLFTESVLPNIIPGNFDDDMAVLSDCDWVLEAVIEKLSIKQDLHEKISQYVKPAVPVTTNTSGISLRDITESLPEGYRKRFFGTHFFNPPRYMHLLEVIPHQDSDGGLVAGLSQWCASRLGKGVVYAQDTPNFIANRIGVFATQAVMHHMSALGLNIETVDALTGPLIGRAKSATFRTMDVVGLDTFASVANNTFNRAPDDPYREWLKTPSWLQQLIDNGHLGQKSGSIGCFKKTKDEKGKTKILAYRPEKGEYEPTNPTSFPWQQEASKEKDTVARLKKIMNYDDAGAQLVWRSVRDVMSYSAYLLEDIAGGTPKPVDDALRWGFNWEWGPFELWQALGYDDVLARMQKEKTPLPAWAKEGLSFYEPSPGTKEWHVAGGAKKVRTFPSAELHDLPTPDYDYHLPTFHNEDEPRRVLSNAGASLLDLGHGVAGLVFHSKMNAIDFDIIEMIQKAVAKVSTEFEALVIGNEGQNFSAGANLKTMLEAIKQGNFSDIERLIRDFQGALQMVKFAPFPTVTCPHSLTLGGGCEVALHGPRMLAASETYAGLVEVGVGLIPAGGGTKELALRAYELMEITEKGDPMPFLQRAFMLIGMARVAGSGQEAVEMGLFPNTAEISMSKPHQIDRAKHLALQSVHQGYIPKIPGRGIKVAGDPGIQTFRLMLYNMQQGRQISEYDAFLGERIASVLCGGDVDAGTERSEQDFLDLERNVFMELCREKKTAERMEHMLKTGKPLRN